MKFRFTFGFLVVVAGLTLGFAAIPAEAQAQVPVAISDTDRSNMKAVLDLTEVALDAMQLQIDSNTLANPAGTVIVLSGIRGTLINMQGLLLGVPLAAVPQVPAYVPTLVPVSSPSNVSDGQMASEEPLGEVAGESMVAETMSQDAQSASVANGASSRWAFWIILLAAVVIAIVLAMPRKESALARPQIVAPQTSAKPQSQLQSQSQSQTNQSREEPQTTQSA